MSTGPEQLQPVARLARGVAVADLVDFGLRNEDWLGEGFSPPRTAASWAAALEDPSQRWYAIVPGPPGGGNPAPARRASDEAPPAVFGLLVLSRWSPPPWRSAEVGYAVDASYSGRGLIQITLRGLLDILLSKELARVEARIDLDNAASGRVLKRLGFSFEGYARSCIDGRHGRRTQAQWALTAADRQAAHLVQSTTGHPGNEPETSGNESLEGG